ncbi:MAG: A/G-specific adenine glycosylase [Myxococcota bacterium]
MGSASVGGAEGHVNPEGAETLREALLTWYDHSRRDLPWRTADDPYATWVSEIMLQQTKVATVLDYYARWMRRFPDVGSLAAAELDEVLELWAGLGYYRRARFLHRGAQYVVEELGGEIPQTAKQLRALPGVGPYTAGAIASIAFGEVEALVDGNVERVLARIFAIPGDPKERANQKQFWALAEALVDEARPGDFNQAMMELGATVCTPKTPRCLLCPVRVRCDAFRLGEPTRFPAKVKRSKPKEQTTLTCVVVAAISGREHVLVTKRPEDGLLAGLLEFPSVTRVGDPGDDDAAMRAHLTEGLGLPEVAEIEAHALGQASHRFSHIAMTYEVTQRVLERPVELDAAHPASPRWIALDAMDGEAFSSAMRKVEALFRASRGE